MFSFRRILYSLYAVIFLDQTYLTITFPLITLIFFDPQSRLFAPDTPLSIRSFWYGSCVALPNIINMFFAPTLSMLSDHVGRKKILLTEIFCAFIFTFMVGLGVYLGSLLLIFIGFTVKGAFCRTNPTALAIVGDVTPNEQKILYMGYLQFAISLGACLGPLLGGYLAMRYFFDSLNFSLPFFIGGCLALINTVFAKRHIEETCHYEVHKTKAFHDLKALFMQKEVIKISFFLFLIQLSWSTYYQFIPPVLKKIYAFDASQIGIFIAMIATWLALTTGGLIRILQRFLRVEELLKIALIAMFVGYVLTILACISPQEDMVYLAWLGAMPIAAGDVLAYSCLTALYSSVVTKYQQGKVMGIALIVVSATWAMTGFFGGILMGMHLILPFIIASFGIITAFYLVRTKYGKQLALSLETT